LDTAQQLQTAQNAGVCRFAQMLRAMFHNNLMGPSQWEINPYQGPSQGILVENNQLFPQKGRI